MTDLTLDELKTMHDKAYNANTVTRERMSDDLVFYWITQWDDQLLSEAELSYRGQFDVLRKAGRQIMSDLRSNPIQVDFEPKDVDNEDGGDLMDGLYRSADRKNVSMESYDYASQDAVVCGFGAWEIYTEYENTRSGDDKQDIKRRWIPEACNTAFCDPNAKRIDKSDARYWSILEAYSEDGYKDLVEELTGERPDEIGPNFKSPEQSYTFPWYTEGTKVYVTSFFHKTKVKEKILTMSNPFQDIIYVKESELDEVMDEMLDSGFEIISEKTIKVWKVKKYIASGAEILAVEDVAGKYIPIIPMYGERTYVEGEEHVEGITRLAKDPQRLRNFQLSYLADIVSKSPRQKPIFTPEQIQGFEDMYNITGSENNFPYLLQNSVDASGKPLPIGPVGVMPEQPVPTALITSIDVTRSAIEDVANPGLPQNISDPDLSGKAVIALQNRMDQQSYIYQHNLKFAKRYDGVVFASIASDIYDAPTSVKIQTQDGKEKVVNIMESIMDRETGKMVTINDLSNTEFDVYSDIGPSYKTQQEETSEKLNDLIQAIPPGDPLRNILVLKSLKLMQGIDFDDVRDYANRQLLLMGVKKPETDEDLAILEEARQQEANQQNPQAQLAAAEGQARLMEGEAAIQNEINDANKNKIEMFKAETDRMGIDIKAAEAGVKIENTKADTFGKHITNARNMHEPLRARVN